MIEYHFDNVQIQFIQMLSLISMIFLYIHFVLSIIFEKDDNTE
jgi:hypothetical protein